MLITSTLVDWGWRLAEPAVANHEIGLSTRSGQPRWNKADIFDSYDISIRRITLVALGEIGFEI
jgi:hypothetical protein